jgi:hypothetical protein
MSLTKFNVIKSWALVMTLAGAIGTSFVAMYRLTEVEAAADQVRVQQQSDHDAIKDIQGDVKAIKLMLEQLLKRTASVATPRT